MNDDASPAARTLREMIRGAELRRDKAASALREADGFLEALVLAEERILVAESDARVDDEGGTP